MKSFTINLGRNHEIVDDSGDVIRSGDFDAVIKGYLSNSSSSVSSMAALSINAELLSEYFSDVLDSTITAQDLRNSLVDGPDGVTYVMIFATTGEE